MTVQPDSTPFITLVLDGRDATDLLDAAVADAQTKLPGWEPREGNTEVVLLEAIALVGQEIIDALEQVPAATAAGFFQLLGVARDTGAPAAALVTFVASDTLGHDVPPGTRVSVALADDPDETVILTTTAGAAIPAGSSTVSVPAVAEATGTAPNGIPTGTSVEVVDALVYVNSAQLASPLTGGRDPEGDAEFFQRAVQRTSRLTDTLVKPEHFTAYALETAGVERAVTVDLYDPAVGPPGSNPGHISVAVMDASGNPLSSGAKAALLAGMDAAAFSQLVPHIIDPTATTVNVTATVHAVAGADLVTVKADAEQAVRDYLSPALWPWSAKVRRTELVSLLDQVDGVDYVDALPTTPSADVTLAGAAPVAVAGTVNITVLAAGA